MARVGEVTRAVEDRYKAAVEVVIVAAVQPHVGADDVLVRVLAPALGGYRGVLRVAAVRDAVEGGADGESFQSVSCRFLGGKRNS